jgi:hypothetical protein
VFRDYPYDVRRFPILPPSAGVFDSPYQILKINAQWASHLDGVLGRLVYEDAWIGTQAEKDAAIQEVQKLLVALTEGVDVDEFYPSILQVPLVTVTKIGGTSLLWTNGSTFYNGAISVTPAAIGNGMQFPFFARKGHYDVYVMGNTNTSYGIATAQVLGGALSVSLDWYNAALLSNVIKVYALDVPSNGENYLQFFVNSKRAASSSYNFLVQDIAMIRTGA